MAYGLKVVAQDGSIIQIDSDEGGNYSYPLAYGTVSFYEEDKSDSPSEIFARPGSIASGYYRTIGIQEEYKPFSNNIIFDGRSTAGNINLTNNTINLGVNAQYVNNGDYIEYVANVNGAIGGLTDGARYYIRDKNTYGTNTIRLSATSGGSVISLTSYATATFDTFTYTKRRYTFYSATGTGTVPITNGPSYSPLIIVSGRHGDTTDYSGSDEYGLQLKNSLGDVTFDSRNYGANSTQTIYPFAIAQPGTKAGNPNTTTAITTDITAFARLKNKTGNLYPYIVNGVYSFYGGYVWTNNHSSLGTGIRWMGAEISTLGSTTSYIDNVFGSFLAKVTTL